MRYKGAFTLIELLVGMGVISILMGMSLVGINIVQQTTRNTQRVDLLNNINKSLTAIYVSTGVYPLNLTYVTGSGGEDQIVFRSDVVIKLLPPLKRQNPSSPLGNTNGSFTNYCYSSTGAEYWVGVQLEDGSWKYFTNSKVPGSLSTCSDSGL